MAGRSLDAIQADSKRIGFGFASEERTGALLAAIAASKPGGRFLEIGTGVGHGTAWMLEGADQLACIETVDSNPATVAIARRHLGMEPRVTFHVADGAQFISDIRGKSYDLIFADAWPGKFSHLDEILSLLSVGGIYVADDLLPQANWPEGQGERVPELLDALEAHQGFFVVRMAWGSGIVIAVRTGADQALAADAPKAARR
ncbi:MAG: methyltransferase domain-containing protein [Betaproteobacteria bacterium]|nr:methyltransferase domain-containing protein [Betaproteobacteria bacterium]